MKLRKMKLFVLISLKVIHHLYIKTEKIHKEWLCNTKNASKGIQYVVVHNRKNIEKMVSQLWENQRNWNQTGLSILLKSSKNWNPYKEQKKEIYKKEDILGNVIYMWHLSHWKCLQSGVAETDHPPSTCN